MIRKLIKFATIYSRASNTDIVEIKFRPGEVKGIVSTCLDMVSYKKYEFHPDGSIITFDQEALQEFVTCLSKAINDEDVLDDEDKDKAKSCLEYVSMYLMN